ncbi:LPXTG cell wall anchor domain-containing protein [Erysipelothrix sp. HDW6B]|uniref:InlB B-repeat-containing protein n=1 Tax=Erysipelothrix sp. HDW6B TaxID=2714929 RepID=UPI00140CC115|nr:InlB B-repeat-containing protein [Erysipelothrix sp. HDW6B]QIK86933.1 LPXTG cell wall anchor domain-containing protein [Erysipelothrix sp. HDW6B]
MKKTSILGVVLFLIMVMMPISATIEKETNENQSKVAGEAQIAEVSNTDSNKQEIDKDSLNVEDQEKSLDPNAIENTKSFEEADKDVSKDDVPQAVISENDKVEVAVEKSLQPEVVNAAESKTLGEWFKNPLNQQVVGARLSKTSKDIVTQEELNTIQALAFESVDLLNHDFSELSSLGRLRVLEFMRLKSFGNVKGLDKLLALESFRLMDSHVNNLNGMQNAIQLGGFQISGGTVEHTPQFLEPISNLKLVDITLSGEGFDDKQVASIKDMTTLVNIRIYDSKFSDTTLLANMVNATGIDLRSNEIKVITPLASLPNLMMLNVSNNDPYYYSGNQHKNMIQDFSAFKAKGTNLSTLYNENQRIETTINFDETTQQYFVDVSGVKNRGGHPTAQAILYGNNKNELTYDNAKGRVIVPAPLAQKWLAMDYNREQFPSLFGISFIATDNSYLGEFHFFQGEKQEVKHKVTYVTNTEPARIELNDVLHNTTVTEPTTLTKIGHTFEGWYTDATFTNKWNFETNKVTDDVTLYGKWVPKVYNVDFKFNNNVIHTSKVKHGDTIPMEDIFGIVIEGHMIEGWFTEPDLINIWDMFDGKVTQNMTLYAKTEVEQFKVDFVDITGNIITTVKDVPYNTVTPNAYKQLLSKVGYTYTLYTDASLNVVWNQEQRIKQDTVVVVDYITNNYTLSFEVNGGSPLTAQTLSHGSLVGLNHTTTREGYTFEGWFLDAGFTEPVTAATTIASNMTIYAQWKEIPVVQKVILSFETNGGTTLAPIEFENGSLIGTKYVTTKSGYTFEGWFLDAGFTTPVTSETTITTNMTIYAQWKEIPVAQKVTLTFETNGGSTVAPIEFEKGSLIGTKYVTTKSGYTFEGWFLDAGFTTPVTSETTITTNMTIYAQWKEIPVAQKVTLTFETNGGSTLDAVELEKGSLIGTKYVTTKSGYTFEGWFLDAGFTTPVTSETTITTNMTIYAQWKEIPVAQKVTLTFETNGGSALAPIVFEKGSLIGVDHSTTKSGYTFGGWFTDAEFKNAVTNETVITENMTIYAKWNKNPDAVLPATGMSTTSYVFIGVTAVIIGLGVVLWSRKKDDE